VSNSSSSSFLVLSKNQPKVPKKKNRYVDYISVEVIEEDYSRSRNEVVRSIEDKLRLVTSFYAMNYSDWENFDEDLYIRQMTLFRHKIRELGEKYNYRIAITTPPIFFYNDFDFDEEGNPIEYNRVCKEIKVSTEWWEGVGLIKDIVEDKDTSRLERLLFNPQSFFIVGGDEYSKNYDLQYYERQKVNKQKYGYEVFGDETKKSWGQWEPYYVHGRVPEYDHYANDEDWCDESWDEHYCQPNLPFDYDLKDNKNET